MSAITYVESVTRAIVLFFATHNWFQCIGHGAFLLDLVFRVLRSSYKGKDTSVFLKVNPEDNAGAYNWNSNRGFKKVVNQSPQFPPHFSDAFAKEEILANYLHVDRNEEYLQWVMKLVKASSVLPIPIGRTVVYERFSLIFCQ